MIGSRGSKFSAALSLKNKEYRARAGSLIAYGILIAKLLLLPSSGGHGTSLRLATRP
jgi:hypothetical protein